MSRRFLRFGSTSGLFSSFFAGAKLILKTPPVMLFPGNIVWSVFSLKEFTSKVDEVVDVEAIRYSARGCAVKLFSVCARLIAALVVEERICEILSICFSRREL